MPQNLPRRGLAALPLTLAFRPAHAAESLATAIASPTRSPKNVARDRYRHPEAVLNFFGLRPTQTVLEIEPGAGYWTEILAPYLKQAGAYIAAVPVPPAPAWPYFIDKVNADPALAGAVTITGLGAGPLAPENSIDLILSFRNLHDWMADGTAAAKLAAMYAALKPGGVLGMEDHRGLTAAPQDPLAKSGYVREDYAKTLIQSAGFRFLAASPIGDNPRDTKNYPAGVWTLPPTLRLGLTDRAKYLAIGESDRWTMKFFKPKS
jgi:predicted methyltransferase